MWANCDPDSAGLIDGSGLIDNEIRGTLKAFGLKLGTVAAVAHHLAGLADIAELLGQFQ